MHDTSALETLEIFSNVLARVPYNNSMLGQSSTPWLTLVILVILGIVVNKAPCSLFHIDALHKYSGDP